MTVPSREFSSIERDEAWLAEWFGGTDAIPKACEICDSGKPVVTVGGNFQEVLGLCETCAYEREYMTKRKRKAA